MGFGTMLHRVIAQQIPPQPRIGFLFRCGLMEVIESLLHLFYGTEGTLDLPFGPCCGFAASFALGEMGAHFNPEIAHYLLKHLATSNRPIVHIMWPFVLCGLTARWSVLLRGRSSVWPHNRLQRLEPLEERRIIAPDGFSTACRSSLCGHVARLERFRLHPQCNFGIAIRRLQADMAQPSTNDIHFHPGFQQMDRRRMAKDMRRNATRHGIRPTLLQMGCVATHEF